MKKFFSQHKFQKNSEFKNWRNRCVWMSSENVDSRLDRDEKKIDKILAGAYNFNSSNIRFLENLEKKELTPERQKKINHIAEFHLSLLGSRSDISFPSRVLFDLKNSKLWRFLNPGLKENIKGILSVEMKKVEMYVSRSIDTLSSSDLTNMTRVYRQLRGSNVSNTKTFQDMAKKLIEKTQKIIKNFQVQKFESDVYAEKLKPRDRLFILEALELFPNQVHLESINASAVLKTLGDSVKKKLESDLESPNFKNRLEYLPLWEVLGDLKLNNLGGSRLESMIKQSQASQFLGWIENWQKSGQSVLLPEHVRALHGIKRDAEDLQSQEDLANIVGHYEPGEKGEKDFEAFLIKWEEENGVFYREEKLSDGEVKRKEINLKKARDTFDKEFTEPQSIIKAFIKNRDFTASQGVFQRVLNSDTGEGSFSSLWNESLLSKNETELMDHYQDFSVKIINTSGEEPDLIFEKLRKRIEAKDGDGNYVLNGFTTDERNDLRRKIGQFEENPLGHTFKQEKDAAAKKIKDDADFIRNGEDDIKQHVEMARRLFNKGKSAEEFLGKYHKNLDERVTKRRLESADLSVLFEYERLRTKEKSSEELTEEESNFFEDIKKSFENEGDESGNATTDVLSEKIIEFREKVKGDLLGEFLRDGSGNLVLETPEGFIEWLEKLSHANFYENFGEILEEIKDLLAINAFDRSDTDSASSLTMAEILDSVRAQLLKDIDLIPTLSKGIRERIDNVISIERNNELGKFMNYYDRSHQGLYDLDQNHKKRVFEEYQNHKKSFETFDDGLKQRNHEAAGGITKEKIIRFMQRFGGEYIDMTDDQIADKLVYILNHRGYMRDVVSGNEVDLSKILISLFPGISKAFNEWGNEKTGSFLRMFGRHLASEGANTDFNEVLDSHTDFLLKGDENFPGLETLNDMTLQLSPFSQEMENLERRFTNKVTGIQDRLDKKEKISFDELNSEVISDWDDYIKSRLIRLGYEAKANLDDIFPESAGDGKFNDIFFKGFESKIDIFDEHIKALKNAYRGKEMEGDVCRDDLDNLLVSFGKIPDAFQVNKGEGKIHELHAKSVESLRHLPDTLKFMKDELGLLEVGGKEKAEKKFKALKEKYQPIIETYKHRAKTSGKKLEKDLKKLDKDQFMRLYSMDKNKGKKQLEDLKFNTFNLLSNFEGEEAVNAFASEMGWENTEEKPDTELTRIGFFQKGYFDMWFSHYSNEDDPMQRMEAIDDMNVFRGMASEDYFKDIKAQNKQMYEFNKSHDKYEKDTGFWESNALSPVRMWKSFTNIQWQWFSVMDIIQMGKDFLEVWERENKKVQEQAVAYLGSSIFGDSAIGKEFQRRAEEAEETRIKEYKQRMEDQPQDQWWEVLYRTNNQDEARGMIDLLSEGGYMRWDDPDFLRTMNRLQSAVSFNVPDDIENLKYPELSEQVEKACTSLWSKKVFDGWDTQLEGNMKKGMEKFDRKFKNLVESKMIVPALGDLLKRWEEGDPTVDPLEFQNYIYQAFKQGEINGPSDPRWFYLIVGTMLKNPQGKTLLSKDIFFFFKGELRPEIPYMDFFGESSSDYWMKDGRLVPKGTPGGHSAEEKWNNQDMEGWKNFLMQGVSDYTDESKIRENSIKFFYQYVANTPAAKARLDKQGRKTGTDSDHDDAWMQSASITYNNMIQVLNKRSEGSDIVSQKWVESFLVGFPQSIEQYYADIKEGDRMFANVPGWQAEKDKKLRDLGERIRIGFVASQTTAGNMHDNTSTFPLTLDQSYWVPGNDAYESRNFLTDIAGDIVGDVEGYGDVKGYIGVLNGNYKELSGKDNKTADPKWKAVNSTLMGVRNSDAFDDPRKVEAMLEKQLGGRMSGRNTSNVINMDFRSDGGAGMAMAA